MKHLIKIDSTPHGVLGVRHTGLDQQYCEAGELVILEWQPEAKWGLQEAHYTDGDGNVTPIDLTPVKVDGKDEVVFTMPDDNITVGGTFKRFVVQDWTDGEANANAEIFVKGTNGEPVAVSVDEVANAIAGGDNELVDAIEAINPFKGWFNTLEELKAAHTATEGDSAYVKDASPATTWSIYVYDSTASSDNNWADSGTDADTSNVQTFASGQEVNEVHIVNDLTTGGVDNVLSAEQGLVVGKHENAYNDLVTTTEIVLHEPKNLLNFDDTDIVTGKFITNTGALGNGSNYNVTGYIGVKNGETYKLEYFDATGTTITNHPSFSYGINEYNADKTLINTIYNASGSASYTPSSSSVKYARFSITTTYWARTRLMCIYGTTPSVFSEYFEPYTTGGDALLKDGVVGGESLKDTTIENAKMKLGAVNKRWKAFTGSYTIASDETKQTSLVNVKENYVVEVIVNGTLGSVRIGLNQGNSAWIDVTPTTLTTHFTSTTDVVTNHGLTLGERTIIVIKRDGLYNTTTNAVVRIYDDYGNVFEKNVYYWYDVSGYVYVKNQGEAEINVDVSFELSDITQKIWVFGDSYISDSGNRWVNQLYKLGFQSYMINGRGGQTGAQGLTDLNNLITLGCVPTYILWCYGMNSGADSSGNVNSNWLAQEQSFLSICEQYDIIPILATIPSVPSEIHTALNNWVRNSGYDYVDFSSAVEDTSDNRNLWRGWGNDDSTPSSNALLSSDKVHPSNNGSIVLALQVMMDFPQIMQNR